MAIKSFKNTETETVFNGNRSRKLPGAIQQRALRKLNQLDAATQLSDLRLPSSNRLHALKDDRQGQHSISINTQWRICFTFENGNANDVEITDYH